jgi:hypothetical protein
MDASLAVFAPSDSAELTNGLFLQIYKRIIANMYAYPGISSIMRLYLKLGVFIPNSAQTALMYGLPSVYRCTIWFSICPSTNSVLTIGLHGQRQIEWFDPMSSEGIM